jgi:hypothetical protein
MLPLQALWLVLLLTLPLAAAEADSEAKPEPEAKPPAGAEAALPEPVIPERKLQFEESEEPWPLRIKGESLADPKTLDLKYVAIVRLAVPRVDTHDFFRGRMPRDQRDFFRVKRLSPQYAVPRLGGQDTLLSFIREMPEERVPAKDVVSEFDQSFPHVRSERVIDRDEAGFEYEHMLFEVRAPSIKRAEELTHGLFAILDHGLCYSNQQYCLRARQTPDRELAELRAEVNRRQEELTQLEKEREALDEFKDLDQTALGALKAQRRLVAVDMAGAQAQIDACHRILGELRAGTMRLGMKLSTAVEQVETLKIEAEIDLVGLTARKEAIDQLVEKAQARLDLGKKVSGASRTIGFRQRSVSSIEETLLKYEAALKANEPFPVRGKITIHPIQWEVIKEDG